MTAPPRGLVAYEDDEQETRSFSRSLFLRLLGYLRPYRRRVLLTIALSFVVLGSALVGPYLLKVGIDGCIGRGNAGGLVPVALLYLIAITVQWLAGYAQSYLMIRTGQDAVFDLRQELFDHLQRLSLRFYDRRKVGRILTRVTNDVNSLQELLGSGLVTVVADIFTLIGILAVMIYLDRRLTLILFLTLPLTAWLAVFVRQKMIRGYREIRRRISNVNANLNETISGIRVTQAFGRETENAALFRRTNGSLAEALQSVVPVVAFFWPAIGMLAVLGNVLVLGLGGWLVLSGSLTIGVLVAYTSYINRFFQPIQNLGNLYNLINAAMASCERIFDFLDERPEVAEAAEPVRLRRAAGAVRFERVSFGYEPDRPVLRDFDLEAAPGEIIALVGPTGAGKTTIINLLCRFYDPTAGRILLDGIDLRRISFADLRRNLAVVLQETFIFSATIHENIRYGRPDASRAEIEAAARAVGIHDFIAGLPKGYDTFVNERGSRLSVGQRQLIAFARALVADPRLLVLDEATANVDSQTERRLQEALDLLLTGRTAFIVAHRLSTIRRADRILVIDGGGVSEEGDHESLLAADGLYARLYRSQFPDEEGAFGYAGAG
ncbi:MAG: ABC transporter ATP-binding protein [Patescibacteria group bacterium]